MKKLFLATLSFLMFLPFLTASPAAAAIAQYEGCYNCGYWSYEAYPTCVPAAAETYGSGYLCTERTWPGGTTSCYTNGISCYAITVTGGGGGGGGGYGGGGGSGCSVANGEVCPAACLACSRPAI